jgi:hypothetical protein
MDYLAAMSAFVRSVELGSVSLTAAGAGVKFPPFRATLAGPKQT